MIAATPAFVVLVDRFRERSTAWQIVTAAGFLLTSFMIYDLLGRWLYLTLLGLSGDHDRRGPAGGEPRSAPTDAAA